jgi:hypothetical protein
VQQKLKVLKIQHLIVSYFGWKMGLATTLGFASLRLTPFLSARRRGRYKDSSKKMQDIFLFLPYYLMNLKFQRCYDKNKRCRKSTPSCFTLSGYQDWLLRSLLLASFNAFPFCSPQGPLQR